jgi:FkbM family methyltransferase
MARRYYSQNGEDALLWSVFNGKQDGIFIEVGAFDGRYLSNTLSFEQQGWTGLCIEAHPDYVDLCRINRPNSICVHTACVAPGEPPTTEFYSEPLGILSGVRAYETAGMTERYASRNMSFPGFQRIEVPAQTLDQLVAKCLPSIAEVDFISIDVEGSELDVLRGCSIQARVIVVEANTTASRKSLAEFMTNRGYIFSRSLEQNLFFVREQATAEMLERATFDIHTEMVMHPLGAAATLREHVGKRICLG